MASLGHRIPPELFKNIILHLVSIVRPLTKKEKREVGQCSLVCRYWAKHSRFLIFERIALRSLDDAQHLLKLAQKATLGVRIGAYVRDIALDIIEIPSQPWIHLLLSTFSRDVFSHKKGWKLALTGVLARTAPEKDRPSPRSAFFGLPRSLPVVQGAEHTKFTGLRFKTFSDLVAFVGSFLPNAHNVRKPLFLELYDTAIADAERLVPLETPPPFRGAHRRWQKRIEKIQSGRMLAWPLVWLLVTSDANAQRTDGRPLYVQTDQMQMIAALVAAVFNGCDCPFCHGMPGEWLTTVLRTPDAHTLEVQNDAHKLAFHLSPAGCVLNIDFNLSFAMAVGMVSLQNVKEPELFTFAWAVLDERVAAFRGTIETFRVQVLDVLYDAYDPFVRAHLPMCVPGSWLRMEKEVQRDRRTV